MKFFYTKICKNSFWNLDIYIIGYTRIIRNVYFRMHVSDYRFDFLKSIELVLLSRIVVSEMNMLRNRIFEDRNLKFFLYKNL